LPHLSNFCWGSIPSFLPLLLSPALFYSSLPLTLPSSPYPPLPLTHLITPAPLLSFPSSPLPAPHFIPTLLLPILPIPQNTARAWGALVAYPLGSRAQLLPLRHFCLFSAKNCPWVSTALLLARRNDQKSLVG